MEQLLKQNRRLLGFFMVALFLSGLTAIPLETELNFLSRYFPLDSAIGSWLDKVLVAVQQTNIHYPFLSYGYDWLAFAHFVLAILFIGPYKDPVKNVWVIEFGLLACLLIIPFALIAGSYRGIPMGWRLIDCSFGFFGAIPLLICLRNTRRLEALNQETFTSIS